MNITVLLVLAWAAFLGRYGVTYVANRRQNLTSGLPGLSPLPERSVLQSRAAAFARQPVMRPARSAAARRRTNALLALVALTLCSLVTAVLTGVALFWAVTIVAGTCLALFVRALRVRAVARRRAYIDKLWAKDRYDDLGHARVMSLEEARRRAQQIADPVYVPMRRFG